MASIAFPVSDPGQAKPVVQQSLEAEGFRVEWPDEWNAVAEIGNTKGVALAGGFKPHIKLTVGFSSAESGAWVNVVQATSGAAGGLLGMRKVKKAFQATHQSIGESLQQASLLTGEPQGT